jgi:predicted transcriptional regulator YdeE
MELQVVSRPAMSFLGVEQRFTTDAEDPGYYNLWFSRFMPRESEFSSHRIDDCYYALVLQNPSDGSWTYMPSVRVGDIPAVPEGMVLQKLRAARFLEFETTVADVGQKWGQIEAWLEKDNQYRRLADVHSYEFYPPNTNAPESRLLIYVPIEAGP